MEKETIMQESYHKLTTNERQLLFKVFRESNFYNFVQFEQRKVFKLTKIKSHEGERI